jgi:hypothetical protein
MSRSNSHKGIRSIDVSSYIYGTRCNDRVLRQTLTDILVDEQKSRSVMHDDHGVAMTANLSRLVQPTDDVHRFRTSKRRAPALPESFESSTIRRASHLLKVRNDSLQRTAKPATLVQVNRLVDVKRRKIELYTLDSDRCNCGRLYLFDSITHTNHCPGCHAVDRVLVVSEDTTNDVIVFRDQTKPAVNELANINVLVASDNAVEHSSTVQHGDAGQDSEMDRLEVAMKRSQTIGTFLKQFCGVVIPDNVIDMVIINSSNTSLMTASRFKTTSIIELFKEKNMLMHIPHAPLIHMMVTNVPVPVLTQELIDAVVSRAQIMVLASLQINQKPPSIELSVHVLLLMENAWSQALAFKLHKTRLVIRKADARLRAVIKFARQIDPDPTRTWPDVRLA